MNPGIELYKLWNNKEHNYTGPYIIHPIRDKAVKEFPVGAITVFEFLGSLNEEQTNEFLKWAESENLDNL